MKRFFAILSLLFLGLSVMAQDVTLKGAWNRAYNAYDFGLDWCFSYNLILSAVGTYINDRRLAANHHNFFMFDLQMSLRF